MERLTKRLSIFTIVWATLLSGFFVMSPLTTNVEAGTVVTGDIVKDTTWTPSGSPYWVYGSIDILGGVTLTIEPGVEVKFNYGGIWVYGNILAIGDSANRITLTTNSSDPKPGKWGGIGVSGHAHFEYVDVTYGSGVWLTSKDNKIFESAISHNKHAGLTLGAHWEQGTNEIRNSTITHNDDGGIRSNSTEGVVLIENSTISNNTGSGLALGTGLVHFIIRNNVISSNSENGIDLDFNSEFDITCNGVFSNGNTGIRIAKRSFEEPDARIHHNNIISNTIQATDERSFLPWDDGSEGNHWSDYSGTDNNGDGIGDLPYMIDVDSTDDYPFMNPISYCPLPDGYTPPVAVANPKNQTVHVNESAQFHGNESYDPDGLIVNYTWDFGDGASGYGETVSHVYSNTGDYSVELTVVDDDNLSSSDSCLVTVVEEVPGDPPAPPTLESAVLSGGNIENVSIRWQLSADDGSGDMDVTNYAIYHSLSYDPNGNGYEFLAEVPAGNTSFLHEGAGDGELNNHFYYVQANDTERLFAWNGQAGKFVRTLNMGFQLASVPFIQDDTTLETVLQTLEGSYRHVRYYRSSDQNDHWKSYWTFKTYRDLFEIDHMMGFWIEMMKDDDLVVVGIIPEVSEIVLGHGWNLVGYPSLVDRTVDDALSAIEWKMVDGYDNSPPYHLRHLGLGDIITAGEGIWIRVDYDQIWQV